MRVTKRSVISALNRSENKSLTFLDLTKELETKKKQKTALKKTLRKMVRAGECWRRGKLYVVPQSKPITEKIGKQKADISIANPLKVVSEKYNLEPGFNPRVEKEVRKIPSKVFLKNSESRKDLRKLPFITIDNDDAKDYDDAIFAEQSSEGFRLFVSIADVSEYVAENSEIDKEAARRGTSVYIPGAVIPMLPEKLSNNVCSLRSGLNRKTLTCEIEINKEGEVLKVEIYPSLIKVKKRLKYSELDMFFSDKDFDPTSLSSNLQNRLKLYLKINEILIEKRKKRGMIDFSLSEKQFLFNKEGEIKDIKASLQSKSMRLVEHFMLEANENVGSFCLANKIDIVWRNHPAPSQFNMDQLDSFLRSEGIVVTKLLEENRFSEILNIISKKSDNESLILEILKTMQLAKYENKPGHHFGLAVSSYCHFTSPIRRYPDLLVHRALKKFLNGEQKRKKTSFSFAAHLTKTEKIASKCEVLGEKIYSAKLLSQKSGEKLRGTIFQFNGRGAFVQLEKPYVTAFLSFKKIEDDYYRFDKSKNIIKGKKTKRVIRKGAKLEVILDRINYSSFNADLRWRKWL
jgi:ribonuclease R